MARQQTLLATVDWSVRLLSDDERRLLVRLAVFHGSAEVAACVDVCGDPTDELDVVDGLSSLHDKSLVHMVADGTARRFRLPETIRQYALQRLVDSDDIAERRERHARWYLATTDDAFSSGARGAIERVRSLCELDMDNLRASAEWLADRDVPAAIHLLLRLNIMSTFWHGMEWVLAPIVDAVARFDEIAAADRALAHIVLAQSARFSFVDVDAEEHRLAARRALVGVDDPATVALVEAADWFQVIYGNAEAERGQVERAVTAARRSGSAVVRALVAIWIGYPADAALGTRMAHDLIELGEEIDDPVMVAVATLELASGRLAWIGRGDEAVRLVHQVRISLDDLVSDSDRLQIALFTAVLEAEHGDLRVGLQLAEDLRERVLRRPNSHLDRGETAACLAHVRRLAGEHDQVLELAQAAGREFSVVVVEGFLEWVGRLALSAELRRLGRLTEAVDTLTDRLVPRAAGTTDWFARVLEEGVHLALGLGRREVAATLLATATDHRARAGKPLSPRGAAELAGVTTELAGSGAAPVSDAAAVELIRSFGSSAG